MEVPFRLVRREATAHATDAHLVFATDAGPLATACAGFAELPDVFAVRGGFLLVSRAAAARAVPGAVKLRRLAGDLFVPVDAELVPTLLPDEALGLTRTRGLIFLPGGTVLAFDATAPLPINRWLSPAKVRREEWHPFPSRPDRANTLTTIERPAPLVAAIIDILGDGAPDDTQPLAGPGEGAGADGAVPEDARPPSSGSRLGRAAASAGLAAGGFLAWLGKQLGAERLARLGGDLARRALERVPRLSEKILGDQEAALREVLRQLQSGDVEKGLRRAPIAVPDPDASRPARVGTDARLSTRDPRYSLRDLIGTGGGVATAWLGGGDVWAELAREYRRLAQEASARGDHRRAAYLYGVLLRDLRSAANALMTGGLFRDAALLFRDRLNDPRAAADAFERAGEYDEALRLYDRLGEYERAAELLRRLGEEERAIQCYRLAANRLKASGKFLAAGDLMRMKAYRRDLAVEFYSLGWRKTGGAESVPCAERLLEEYHIADDRPAFEGLLNEAETALADRPRDAGRVFNYALQMSDDFLPEDARADLFDRARLRFAGHARTAALIGEAGALVGELFRTDPPWASPVHRDATFATRWRPPLPTGPTPSHEPDRRLVGGPVTAVALVRGTFDVVVAGSNGPDGIVIWRIDEGRVVPVAVSGERITALSTSWQGDAIYAATNGIDGSWRVRCFAAERSGPFQPVGQCFFTTDDSDDFAIYLQPATACCVKHRIVIATPVEHVTLAGPYLAHSSTNLFISDDWPMRLLVEAGNGHTWGWAGNKFWHRGAGELTAYGRDAPWTPATPVEWLTPAPEVLEVAAVDAGGDVRWAEFNAHNSVVRSAFAMHPNRYAVACLVGPGTIVAVTSMNEVHWLRVSGTGMTVSASVTLSIPDHVFALVARPDPNEVIVILAGGSGIRLRRP